MVEGEREGGAAGSNGTVADTDLACWDPVVDMICRGAPTCSLVAEPGRSKGGRVLGEGATDSKGEGLFRDGMLAAINGGLEPAGDSTGDITRGEEIRGDVTMICVPTDRVLCSSAVFSVKTVWPMSLNHHSFRKA